MTRRNMRPDVFDFGHKRVAHHRNKWQPYGLRDPETGEKVTGAIILRLKAGGGRRRVYLKAQDDIVRFLTAALSGVECACTVERRDEVIRVVTSACRKHGRLRM